MGRPSRFVLAAAFLFALVAAPVGSPPGVLAGAAPPPDEKCVPGTILEDQTSGVKYICIYDELYGGTRWDVLHSPKQKSVTGFTYRSSTYGCVRGTTAITSIAGSGADSVVAALRWPCERSTDRVREPRGELRSRVLIQVYDASGWRTCRDTGYLYSTAIAYGWVAGYRMGAYADCGTGQYRALGYGGFLAAGAWRGGTLTTGALAIR